ncbi:hypothetical protein OAA62_01155 [bacterium]|nr:hypothetical protein [bacterium]
MILNEKNIMYSFPISMEKEVEEEIEKTSKRKNKETGKMETIKKKETIVSKKDIPYNVYVKKPNRAELEDGDMFYSLELNKYIKMGLMTKAMLAKQYGNQGGVWSEKEQNIYSDLMFKMHKKQFEVQQFSILEKNKNLSERQSGKLEESIRELAQLKKELTEYEMMQNSLFDHTADVKARNRTIMWYILHLSYFTEGESEKPVYEGVFDGDGFDEKYQNYQDKEESQDEFYKKIVDKISSIVTVWYISGNQDKENIDSLLEEMQTTEKDD